MTKATLRRDESHSGRAWIAPGTGHPGNSERLYSEDEMEFIGAMDAFKQHSGKTFPTWSDALAVMKGLGYSKAEHQARINAWLTDATSLGPEPPAAPNGSGQRGGSGRL